jgi:hypothetical protein
MHVEILRTAREVVLVRYHGWPIKAGQHAVEIEVIVKVYLYGWFAMFSY